MKDAHGCAYGNHEFSIECGMAYENERFTVYQDWKLPIKGFFIVSPKRHVEKFCELTVDERNEMFDIVNKTIAILRNNNICDRFDYIFEEKVNRHLHVWLLPRYDWMDKVTDDIIENIGKVFNFAKTNFRNPENFEEIKRISDIVKRDYNK